MEREPQNLQEFNVIGKRCSELGIERFDSRPKASGSAIYSADIERPNMLWAKMLHCPYAHARIKSMDSSKAEALPGVKYVLRYDDPEIQAIPVLGGSLAVADIVAGGAVAVRAPEALVMGSDEFYWEGEEGGVAVAAESEEICDEALKLIDVEWEELPFVLDIEEAMKPGAPILHPEVNPDSNLIVDWKIEKGDVEAGFAEADFVFQDRYTLRPLTHCGAETWNALAEWKGDRVTVWSNVQKITTRQTVLASQLGIPYSKVNYIVNYKGGSFGQENTCSVGGGGYFRMQPFTAILAKRTGRPVKMHYSRRDQFYCAEPGMVADVEVGAKDNGKLTAVHIKAYGNGQSGGQVEIWCFGLYSGFIREDCNCPNILSESGEVFVNKCPTWWFRCEENENSFIMGSVLDRVAEISGVDPTEVALINGLIPEPSLKECIEAGKKAIGWDEKWHAPGTKTLPSGKLHGMGFNWSHEFSSSGGAAFAASIRIEPDGSVKMMADVVDIGVAPHTTYAMIVAEVLGARIQDVYMPVSSTDVGIPQCGPGGSIALSFNSAAWVFCANETKRQLLERAAPKLEVSPDELDIKDSVIFVKADPEKSIPFSSVGYLTVTTNPTETTYGWPWAVIHKDPTLYQTHFCEVEVDTETGQIEVTKVVNVNDAGQVIMPEIFEGQQYGASIMGWGRPLTEDMIYDPMTGVLLNGNLYEFKFATMNDCGPIETITKNSGLGYGVWGLCGVGEDCATVLPCAITNAIYNAIGVRIQKNPIYPEDVLRALGKI